MTAVAHPTAALAAAGLTPDDCGWPLTDRGHSAVAARIEELVADLAGPLTAPARRITAAPGKLVRPALSLTCAALGGDVPDRALSAAASVELLHCATLVHDDLIDGAEHRRGVPTVHAREGLGTAVVTGDLLIAAALTAAAAAGPAATAELARTLAELCVGQQSEDHLRFDPRATPEDALAVARGKTGSLLRAACVTGAIAAGLPTHVTSALGEFGMAFGLLLQVLDDVLDLVSSPELLGKPVAADFAAGTMTLPITYALCRRPGLVEALRPGASDEELAAAHSVILASGAVAAAVRTAVEQVRVAEQALGRLESSPGLHPILLARLAGLPRHYLDALPHKVVPDLRYLLHRDPDGGMS